MVLITLVICTCIGNTDVYKYTLDHFHIHILNGLNNDMPTSFPFLVTTTNMLLTTCTAKYTTHLLLWSTQKQGISTETKFHDLTDLVAAGRCSSLPVLLFWTFLCFQPQFMHFYGPLLLAATLSQILHLLNRWIRQQVYIPTGTSHFGILFLCSPVVRSFLFV